MVTLGHFEAGWGWEAQIRQYIRKKYRQDLEGLPALDPWRLARLLRGELLPERPYATIVWVMRLCPFRPMELYWFLDHDPEFGVDFRVLYARKSLAVPTEDAYVFAWDYLALFARYGRGTFPLGETVTGSEWVPFPDFAPDDAFPIKEAALGPREELLTRLTPEVVKVALARMETGVLASFPGGWEVIWPFLGDLAMRLRVRASAVEVAFDNQGVTKYPPELLLSFAWLYINALLREARQVEPSLPRLSRYL